MPIYKEKQLQRLIEISTEFIDLTAQELSYQKISDYMLELSEAKHVVLNIKKNNGKIFTTVTSWGSEEKFDTDDAVVIGIGKNKENIGYFTLTIAENQYSYNKEIIGLYTAQVALLLVGIKALKKCENSKKSLENVIEATKVGTWEWNVQTGERLKDEYERFFAISTDLLCIADMDGNLLSVNNAWETLLGYQPLSMKNRNFLDFVHPEDFDSTKEIIAKLNAYQEVANFVVRYRYSDGKYYYMEWLAQPYDNFIYGSARDITEKYERQKEVEFLSFRDYLTGLYNRRDMEDAIKRLDTPRNYPLTVMVVDINGLKLTNDAFGHKVGDELIKVVGDIIKKTCRSDDIIGRMGGDEFLLLLPNTDYTKAKKIQDRMIDEARNTQDDSFIISFAIGWAVKTMTSQDIREIEKTADKNMYRNKSKYGKLMRNETIETALETIFRNDNIEQVHAERVSLYCGQIAEAMGLGEHEIEDAKISGVLHDIGKITIAMNIPASPHKLLKEEWEEIKRHPITGYNILKGADEYAHLAEGVLYHHERLDGKGYPEGLTEKKIPRLSKIIAVADAYEAMTSDRPYRKARTQEEAIAELKEHSGTQFDSKIVKIFISKVI